MTRTEQQLDICCERCRWFTPVTDEMGACRRHAPHPFVPSSPKAIVREMLPPMVNVNNFCGEFEDA